MKKLTYEEILDIRPTPERALMLDRHPVSLMLDNIRSAYNVGSIFRTADSALAASVILCGYTATPPKKEVLKTALGATDSVPWVYVQDIKEAIKQEKANGKKVYALEITDSSKNYTELTAEDFPITIVLGNEVSGVSDEALELCDGAIEIPMYGVKHSLNVSVSTGIALYEAVKAWHVKNRIAYP
jgi:tRNA G18 (ribose-2'-O)-methylase SpoU